MSLNFGHDDRTFLVNSAGKRTQLQQKGKHLYLVACPFPHGLSTCSRGSLPAVIGFLPEDKELDDQELALQSSSSTDLVEDKSFLESLYVHEKSSLVCVLCEDVAVSGGELSSHSFSSMQQQQPRKLSREDHQLHNSNPRSTLQRSEELQEAKGRASKEKIAHVLSAACVCDLPDRAWHDPSLVCRGSSFTRPAFNKEAWLQGNDSQNCSFQKHKMLEDTRSNWS